MLVLENGPIRGWTFVAFCFGRFFWSDNIFWSLLAVWLGLVVSSLYARVPRGVCMRCVCVCVCEVNGFEKRVCVQVS